MLIFHSVWCVPSEGVSGANVEGAQLDPNPAVVTNVDEFFTRPSAPQASMH